MCRETSVSRTTEDARRRPIRHVELDPQQTLIVHGNKDVVVIPINAFLLEQHLPDAQLLMYPDASHASHSLVARNRNLPNHIQI